MRAHWICRLTWHQRLKWKSVFLKLAKTVTTKFKGVQSVLLATDTLLSLSQFCSIATRWLSLHMALDSHWKMLMMTSPEHDDQGSHPRSLLCRSREIFRECANVCWTLSPKLDTKEHAQIISDLSPLLHHLYQQTRRKEKSDDTQRMSPYSIFISYRSCLTKVHRLRFYYFLKLSHTRSIRLCMFRVQNLWTLILESWSRRIAKNLSCRQT